MKDDHRTPSEELIAAKVPTAVAREIKRLAREDDRTVSAWLRRHLADALGMSAKPAPVHHESEQR